MLITGQASATETAGALCTIPSGGACLITITSDPASTDTAYIIGLSPAGDAQSDAADGLPLPPGTSITTATYGDSTAETDVQVACGSGGTATVGYLISSH